MNPIAALKSSISSIILRRRFPTSVIHYGATVDSSSILHEYTVLFRNASLINSTLGAYSYIQSGSLVCNAQIGKFCSIASGVDIGLPQHLLSSVSSHPIFYSKNTPLPKTFSETDNFIDMKKTLIGNDVWIGQKAMIMSGICIGCGAVIGAGAVVTKDIPPYAIVVGIPAKIIKYRFDENIRNALLLSNWWDMSEDWLIQNYRMFNSPEELLKALAKLRLSN